LLLRRNGEPAVLAITCGYGAFASPEIAESKQAAVVRYPCVSKLDSLHLLKAIAWGVDGIIVVSCSESQEMGCQYKESQFWVNRRISHAHNLLTELGLEAERLILTELPEPSVDSFNRVLEESVQRFKQLGPSPVS
ncbi:MAG TPA: hydrogenase iron-sulfur subunit, partial [Firmicutes bacterium]|nr:hydrogenase iron-sulfur subunit [Bacillota bacterium]